VIPISTAYPVFYKHPGSIPVIRGRGSSPGVFPGDVELHHSILAGGVLAGEFYIIYGDVVGTDHGSYHECEEESDLFFHNSKFFVIYAIVNVQNKKQKSSKMSTKLRYLADYAEILIFAENINKSALFGKHRF